MLTELEKVTLKMKMIPQEDIDNIVDYDMKEGVVTFKDGTKRTVCECYTRIMGYVRNVDNFNKGKKSEFEERVWFTESKACPCEREAA